MKVEKTATPAIVSLVAAVLLWGGSFSAMRTILVNMEPMTVMWIRMMLASLFILPFLSRIKPPEGWKKDYKVVIPMVLFQPCLYFLLESNALRFTTSSQAGIISSFVPLFVTVGAWFVLKEPLRMKGLTGLLISITGVVVLTLLNEGTAEGQHLILGNTMEAGAMICAAANMLIIKKLSSRYNPWTLTMMQCFAGALFFSPGILPLIQQGINIDGRILLLLLYLGAPVSLGAFGLYNFGMSRMAASGASVFINMVPVVAVISGWILLGESLTNYQILASVAVIIGVLISQETGVSLITLKKNSRREGSKRSPLWSFRN